MFNFFLPVRGAFSKYMDFQKLYIFSFFWDNGTGDWEGSGSKRSRGLGRGVGLAIGMRVMVTDNIETDLGPYKWGSRWNCGYHSSSRWAIDWELACGASTVHAFVHPCQTQSHRSDTFGRPFWQYHPIEPQIASCRIKIQGKWQTYHAKKLSDALGNSP